MWRVSKPMHPNDYARWIRSIAAGLIGVAPPEKHWHRVVKYKGEKNLYSCTQDYHKETAAQSQKL
jgi:hypothetical protein